MVNDKKYSGVFTLLLTPFNTNGAIDWAGYDRYVDWQLEAGPHGLFSVCGSSEMAWLSLSERLKLAKQAAARAGNTPVLATANVHPQSYWHKEELKRMSDTGVSGIVLVPPDKMGTDQQQLENYLRELAESSELPVFLYEWPQNQPNLIEADVWGRLSEISSIKGIKDTTCTMEDIQHKISRSAGNTTIFQANTPFLLDAVKQGAGGIMATITAAFNESVLDFWKEATVNPDSRHSSELHQQLVLLDSVQRFAYPATAKHLASLQGIPMSSYCRWPVELSREAAKAVEVFYESYHVWKRNLI
ncbi:dihydrodipicolinate synthase family protein [Alteribacillus sp. HJP-4]|uniref:dihydrodipicolinate synthase family protein n=1 Tax=Alteribacillus sp. HJP-4 TaxID=2775394 RepID=UPI0035CCCE32